MALIEFKNLPDTSTPINAENLNNNFNELKNRKYILLSTDSTIQVISASDGWQKINFASSKQYGNVLSFDSNNSVVIVPSNVKKVRVAGSIGGRNAAWIKVYSGAAVDPTNAFASGVLMQPASTRYWAGAIPITEIEYTTEVTHYIALKGIGYDSNNDFRVNDGMPNATTLMVEVIE